MTTRHRAVERTATCLQCRWRLVGPNAQGVGARHHDLTGHQVEVVITTVYGHEQQATGQTDILTALTEQDTPQ